MFCLRFVPVRQVPRLAAYDSAVSSSLPPPNVTVVRRADQAAFKSLLLDTCATPRPHPLAVPA